jgi:threonine dehydrogenase-like Zn-dependent dehydrogenase
MGFNRDGFFAEYVAIPTRNVVPIPTNVSDEEAAILEPVALAIRTLNRLKPKLQNWVTVVGQGTDWTIDDASRQVRGMSNHCDRLA